MYVSSNIVPEASAAQDVSSGVKNLLCKRLQEEWPVAWPLPAKDNQTHAHVPGWVRIQGHEVPVVEDSTREYY